MSTENPPECILPDEPRSPNLRVVIEGGRLLKEDRAFPLEGKEQVLIGRGEDCDLILQDRCSSKRHVVLAQAQEGWSLRDLGGKNRASVGGIAAVGTIALDRPQVILVGRTFATLRTDREVPDSDPVGNLAGLSYPSRLLYRALRRAAEPAATVLLQGETGTGKEECARALHDLSGGGKFVEVNCANLSRELFESELFGHERGAFTDARTHKRGLVEEGDTLFLDEIGELPIEVQPKLLRFLESRTFRRVGGAELLSVTKLRVIAATNRDLEALVRRGRFRADLLRRFRTMIDVPPLRDRPEDVPRIIHARLAAKSPWRSDVPTVWKNNDELLHAAMVCSWPQNVRQLVMFVDNTVKLDEDPDAADVEFIREFIRENLSRGEGETAQASEPRVDLLRDPKVIERELEAVGGNVSELARKFGVPRPTIYSRLQAAHGGRGKDRGEA